MKDEILKQIERKLEKVSFSNFEYCAYYMLLLDGRNYVVRIEAKTDDREAAAEPIHSGS